MLEGWDDEARKYKESGTGGLHTKERCQEAKAKLKQSIGSAPTTEYLEAKNDHGNELTESRQNNAWKTSNVGTNTLSEQEKLGYVDHTQGQKLKLKVLTSTEAEGLSLLYNTFGDSHTIRFSQYQIAGSLYTIAIFFEEVPLKQ
jgi:hypothetical protein